MLDLVRMSPRPLFPPGGEQLSRQIALLSGMEEDTEVLDVGCGPAVALEYFVREFGVHGSGIDDDPRLVQSAIDRARNAGLGSRMQIQEAPADRLPYVDEIFDVAVGELGMTRHADPAKAVRELVRVTRPGGFVVLVQLVWKAPVDEERRRVLTEHLGVTPLMLVEWKRLLKENGVGELHTEDWTDDQTAFRPRVAKPFPDFAELFTVPEKIGIFRRAWGRWGWSGVRAALAREWQVHRLLTHDRVLGLDLLRGRRQEVPAPTGSVERTEIRRGDAKKGGAGDDASGLPLFDDEPGRRD